MNYTDQMVVSAFNSCIDMKKFKELPHHVQERVKKLFQKHRIKPVCFFNDCGFGLKVYVDNIQVRCHDEDECSMLYPPGISDKTQGYGVLDEDGHWMRCPPSLHEEAKKTPLKNKTLTISAGEDEEEDVEEEDVEEEDIEEAPTRRFIVCDKRGTRFVGQNFVLLTDEDSDAEEEPNWRYGRSYAFRFTTRARANQAARKFDGIVLDA